MQTDLQLVPGVQRLRPDDHFMILSETDASPMHVGALLVLDTGSATGDLAAAFRQQLAERLPATPLLARLVSLPDGYDSDVWAELATCDLDRHVQVVSHDRPWSEVALCAAIAESSMQRLDLSQPPFQAQIFEQLETGGSAVYFRMHHSVADGIGFQSVLQLLSDAAPPVPPRTKDAALPTDAEWRALAERRFAAEAELRARQARRRKVARAALDALDDSRVPTPQFGLSGVTSNRRDYATTSLSLVRIKQVGRTLGATVNDVFLTLASTAVRDCLAASGNLPTEPLVVNSARSYRRSDHGPFGNRIVAIHPQLATDLADPLQRLRRIQQSMAAELARSRHEEQLLDAVDKPFGARDRRAAFAKRMARGRRLIPGNLTLSNVPGPTEARSYAGFRLLRNFPVPIIGSGRFLNITSRRNADSLDMGISADAEKPVAAGDIAARLQPALAELEKLA